jgi:hypothetical protein
MRRLLGAVFSALLFFSAVASAEIVDLGVFSFDNLIPAGATPGVNVFDISNFTGATWSLPPDYPVVTELTLQDAMLTLNGSGGPQQISLGDIAPGLFTPPSSVQFVDTETFTSAILTGMLSDTSLSLFDGTSFTAASPTFSATILPSIGSDLTAGVDFAVISASGQASSTPEPTTAALLTGGLLLLATIARKPFRATYPMKG